MEFEILNELSQPTMTYYNQLRDELKKQIEKEFQEKLKNPCLLPVDLKSIEQNSSIQYRERVDRGTNPDSDTSHVASNLRGNTTRISHQAKTVTTRVEHIKDDESNISSDQLSAQKTGSLVSKTQKGSSAGITQKTKEFSDSLAKENLHLILSEEEFKLLNSDIFQKNLVYVERI